jgi:hypothetical protein
MPSCDDCGLIFENISDLATHMNRWCPENNDSSVRPSFTYLSTFDSHLSSFASLASVANFVKAISSPSSIIVCSSKRDFLDSLLSSSCVDLDQFMSRYGTLIQYILQLKNGKLHSKVMKVVDDLLEDGMDYKKAVKVAIAFFLQYFYDLSQSIKYVCSLWGLLSN